MSAGISQENGQAQDITFEVNPGEIFLVPQGLLHYNHNQECIPNVFFQSFDSADGGAINIAGALTSLLSTEDGMAALIASGLSDTTPSPQGSFALDQACLARCGFPETGAPGTGFEDLPEAIAAIAGAAINVVPESK